MKIMYFGCMGRIGHFLHGNNWGMTVHPRDLPATFPLEFKSGDALDGTYAPKCNDHEQHEGHAALHHVGGWTVLSWWDRSLDTRRGSNSTFVLEGEHDAESALAAAKEAFPSVFSRMKYEVILP